MSSEAQGRGFVEALGVDPALATAHQLHVPPQGWGLSDLGLQEWEGRGGWLTAPEGDPR